MSKRRTPPRVALALAGGGPLGAIHEIGALCALQEALPGLALQRLDHYVGVSAGAFLAAGLANGVSPRELCAAFIENTAGDDLFDPAWLMVPAYREFLYRALRAPGLAAAAVWRASIGRRPRQALGLLAPLLPTGVLANDQVDRRLARMFSRPGRSNDFRQLRSRLTIVATDLDTGDAVPFGQPGWDHVPVSKAVQASAAMPGLFPPVTIDGRDYVDGALKKTLHASVALEQGVDLLLCLNPLVPFHSARAAAGSLQGVPRIAEGGLVAVLNQTFRTLIHSRLELRLGAYRRAWPHTDIVLLEPDPADAQLYLANPLGYRQRREMAEHAYQQTRAQLLARSPVLAPKLARHGLTLREDVLRTPRRLLAAPRRPRGLGEALAVLQQTLDELASQVQAAPPPQARW